MSAPTYSFFCSRALCRAVLAAGIAFTAFAQAQVSLTQLSEDTFTDTPSRTRHVLVRLDNCERISGGSDFQWRRRRHWVRDFDRWRRDLDQWVSAGHYDLPGRNEHGGERRGGGV